MNKMRLTTASGRPYSEFENTMTVGPRGPVLLQDHFLIEELAHFNRERIPERVTNACGCGAFGTFTATNDITRFTNATLFAQKGKQTRVFARFSTMCGERGSADCERDIRGFELKFYTDEGNFDIVGCNSPVGFVKDPKKLPHLVHALKRDPRTNLRNPTNMWDYMSLNPETTHQMMIMMSDRGTPENYRQMNGYGCYTYSLINRDNERIYCKFHFLSQQGIRNFTSQQAQQMCGKDPDHARRDLIQCIEKGDFPKWSVQIQVMTEKQAKHLKWNPFDVTKVWPHKDFPLMEAGRIELNEIPENYFRDVEQSAFDTCNVVRGISFSPDRMLQGSLFACADANRYRLGANYSHIPVNRCLQQAGTYQRDGMMQTGDNGGSSTNYRPNRTNTISIEEKSKEPALNMESNIADYFDRNEHDTDHYSQPGYFYRNVLRQEERENLINNFVESMQQVTGDRKEKILKEQIQHLCEVDGHFGTTIADRLGIRIEIKAHKH